MLYVPSQLGGQSEFYAARPHSRNIMTHKHKLAGQKAAPGQSNAAHSNDQEWVSTALYSSNMVKIILPRLESPVPKMSPIGSSSGSGCMCIVITLRLAAGGALALSVGNLPVAGFCAAIMYLMVHPTIACILRFLPETGCNHTTGTRPSLLCLGP